jgi:predicted metalloendopeptidase
MAKNETESLELLDDVRNYTVSDLQDLLTELIPNHPVITVFEKYLNLMFEGMPEQVKFNQSGEEVMTSYSDILYFSTMIVYLKQVLTLQDLELYIWWNVVENAIPYTTDEMRVFYSQYITELEMTSSRMDYCTDFVNSMMGMATSEAIINQEFQKISKPKIEDTFHNIREVFKQIVAELEWMDEHSKVETLGKLERMQTLIGFPEWLLNQTALAQYYTDVRKNLVFVSQILTSRKNLNSSSPSAKHHTC